MQTQIINTAHNSSLLVFAEKVQEERLARKNYFIKSKKASDKEKNQALVELKRIQEEVDVLLYSILKPQPERAYGGNGGGTSHS